MGRFNAVLTATSDNYDFCERPVSPLSSTRNGHGVPPEKRPANKVYTLA
jgi:hypothetical protein